LITIHVSILGSFWPAIVPPRGKIMYLNRKIAGTNGRSLSLPEGLPEFARRDGFELPELALKIRVIVIAGFFRNDRNRLFAVNHHGACLSQPELRDVIGNGHSRMPFEQPL
jgi:hypothetical protein